MNKQSSQRPNLSLTMAKTKACDKDNPCKNPQCYSKCKGPRGLSIHLGLSKTCSEWYKKTFGRHSPSVSSRHVSETSSVSSSVSSKSNQSASSFLKRIFPLNLSGLKSGRRHSLRRLQEAPVPAQVEDTIGVDKGVDGTSQQAGADPFEETFLTIQSDLESVSEPGRVDSFPGAAKVFTQLKGKTILEDIKEARADAEERNGIYYPFSNSDDFTVAAWLSGSGASMATIDRFLKLPFVSYLSLQTACALPYVLHWQVTKQERLSFRTAQELYTKIAQLPQPPKWKSRTVSVPGGTTTEPLKLLYRDGLEVFKFLFANPVFAGKQNFVPQKCWMDVESDILFSDEPTTGHYMWEVQVCGKPPFLTEYHC